MFSSKQLEALKTQLSINSERLDRLETAPPPSTDTDLLQETNANYARELEKAVGQIDQLNVDLNDLVQAHKDIVIAVAEGIERVDRSERRIQGTVKRAQKKLANHGFVDEGLEAENDQLQLIDGDRGKEPGMQPVRNEMEGADEAISSIEGVTRAQLRRARGI